MKSPSPDVHSPVMGWDSARLHCERLGYSLAIVRSAADQESLEAVFASHNRSWRVHFWLGLHRSESSSEFEWVDGTPLNFTNWLPGSPSEEQTHVCTEVYENGEWQWKSSRCSGPRSFACSTLPPVMPPVRSPPPPSADDGSSSTFAVAVGIGCGAAAVVLAVVVGRALARTWIRLGIRGTRSRPVVMAHSGGAQMAVVQTKPRPVSTTSIETMAA